ncbi:MAG: hypothetical protein WDO24_22905 [Pseudomonadota bacterium]
MTTSRHEIRTAKGPLYTLPYTVELNDIPMMMVQHHSADELLKRTTDQFDRLYAEGAERAKIMAVAVHPIYQRRAAPDQIFRGDLRIRQETSGGGVLDRRADPRLVSGRAAMRRLGGLAAALIAALLAVAAHAQDCRADRS